jgi:hypothetical protein
MLAKRISTGPGIGVVKRPRMYGLIDNASVFAMNPPFNGTVSISMVEVSS